MLKYKNEKGEWVSIPCLVSDIYNAYVTYCKEKGVEPVTQDDYYISVGTLGTLVSQLASSSAAIQDLSAALNKGVLPATLGGTGVLISPNEYEYILLTEEPADWNTDYSHYYKKVDGEFVARTVSEPWKENTFYKQIPTDFIGSTFKDYLISENGAALATAADIAGMSDKIDASIAKCTRNDMFLIGSDDPTKVLNIPETVKYYFQIKT
jgi:hypothetical protein